MIDVNNVNLNLLRFFIVTAESKSIAEAGEKSGYSHSTVSANISTLESQIGVKLFTRKPLKLTDVGKEIYETVKHGFMDIDFAMLIATPVLVQKLWNTMMNAVTSAGFTTGMTIVKWMRAYPAPSI